MGIKEFLQENYIPIAVALGLFTILANHLLTKHRNTDAEKTNAAKLFRESICNSLSDVYPTCNINPENLVSYLNEKYSILQSVVEQYRPYVKDRRGFEEAWINFKNGGEFGPDEAFFFHYSGYTYDGKPQVAPEKLLKENINKMLSYANT